MTDREYESIKRAEKERLRAKKRLQKLVEQVRREGKSTSIVQSMIDAGRSLLDETSAWTDRLTADAARAEARMDVTLDAETSSASRSSGSSEANVQDYEAEEAEARADQLVRQIRAATQPRRLRDDAGSSRRSRKTAADASASATPDRADESESESDDALPDKTIGRMRR